MNLFLVLLFGLLAAALVRAAVPYTRPLPVALTAWLGISGALLGLGLASRLGVAELLELSGSGLASSVVGAAAVVMGGAALWRIGAGSSSSRTGLGDD